MNGGDKAWSENPYRALGRRALENATADFSIGTEGAGTGATTMNLKGGLGSASLVLDNGLTVGALVAANPVGAVTVGQSANFWAAPCEVAGEFGGLGPASTYDPLRQPDPFAQLRAGTNTTIAIVATDAMLTQAQATRLAVAAHDGMARAIYPSHTPYDGDLVFAAATGEKPLADPAMDPLLLGHAAALCLARAIARGVHAATPAPGDPFPTWQQKFAPD